MFGQLIIAGLLSAALALRKRSTALGALSGAAFGLGYLVNPVIALLPLLLLPLFRQAIRPAVVMVTIALLAVAGWTWRNTVTGAESDGRAAMNFVQGSWPEYHEAWRLQRLIMRSQFDRINADLAAMDVDREAGLRRVAGRLFSDPVRYAEWYVSKIYLLWDWDIRIGRGIYTTHVNHSPLDGPLLPLVAFQYAMTPLVFALAACGLVLAWPGPAPLRMAAIGTLYFTAVHVLLQAEPRYAIPYRALEILLAIGTCAFLRKALGPGRISPDGDSVRPIALD